MLRVGDSPVTAADIKSWTDKDPVLSRVRNMVVSGWQPHIGKDEEFLPYKLRDMELSVQDGCVLHVGADAYVAILVLHEFFCLVDSDLEGKVKNCQACQRKWQGPRCFAFASLGVASQAIV